LFSCCGLAAAIAGGYPEIADALLAANAYLYDRPLYTAVNTGSLSMVRYLAAHRGLINKNSVLLTALRESHLNIADYLLTQGAVLAPQQALCDALGNRDTRVVAWLLQHGVDVNTPVHNHDTPLVHAMDDLPMLRFLLEHKADPNLPHGYDTPMHLVGDSLYTLQLLIAHGGNVNTRNKFEQTPLFMPLGMDTAPYLIAHGAKINSRDKAKRTPLHRQSVLGDAMVVELLIQHGADVNARDNFSRTPLHFVKNAPTMIVLLEHGANPNAVDKDGNTPLHTLFDLPSTLGRIKNYYEEDSVIAYPDREKIDRMIHLLLQKKADPTRRNKKGETPAQVARANNQSEFAPLLRPHN
jgi:ankyrin repeat protein